MAALHKGGKRMIMKVFVRYYTTNEHLLTYICKRNHKQTNNNKRNEETTKSHTLACRHSHGNSHHAGRRTAARGHRTGESAFRHAPARAPFVSRPLTEHIENRSQTGQDGHQGHTESHRPHCRAGRGHCRCARREMAYGPHRTEKQCEPEGGKGRRTAFQRQRGRLPAGGSHAQRGHRPLLHGGHGLRQRRREHCSDRRGGSSLRPNTTAN